MSHEVNVDFFFFQKIFSFSRLPALVVDVQYLLAESFMHVVIMAALVPLT